MSCILWFVHLRVCQLLCGFDSWKDFLFLFYHDMINWNKDRAVFLVIHFTTSCKISLVIQCTGCYCILIVRNPISHLLTFGQLIKLFSFLWIIHALFRLAPSHFCGGNLTNPIYVYARIYQQRHVFLINMIVIFISPQTKEFYFLIGEFRIIMNTHEN